MNASSNFMMSLFPSRILSYQETCGPKFQNGLGPMARSWWQWTSTPLRRPRTIGRRRRRIFGYRISHCYANPAHEDAALEAIAAAHPELFLSASHDVSPKFVSMSASTTSANAYVKPLAQRYLDNLTRRPVSALARRSL